MRRFCLLIALCATFTTGCGNPPNIKVTTLIRENGSCERTTIQPRLGYLPSEARQGETLSSDWIKRWNSVVPLEGPDAMPAPGEPLTKYKYFKAQGEFASPDEIPVHYRYLGKTDEAGHSELEREFTRTDFGLLVDYEWAETLTNNVTLENYLANRDKLLDQSLPEFARVIHDNLGRKYETRKLEEYLVTDLRSILVEVSLAYYDVAANKRPNREMFERMGTIARRHELEWPEIPAGTSPDVGDPQAARSPQRIGLR